MGKKYCRKYSEIYVYFAVVCVEESLLQSDVDGQRDQEQLFGVLHVLDGGEQRGRHHLAVAHCLAFDVQPIVRNFVNKDGADDQWDSGQSEADSDQNPDLQFIHMWKLATLLYYIWEIRLY